MCLKENKVFIKVAKTKGNDKGNFLQCSVSKPVKWISLHRQPAIWAAIHLLILKKEKQKK